MNRREFLAAGVGGVLGAQGVAEPRTSPMRTQEIRSLFPRLQQDVFLNAAAGTPLSRFTQAGLRRYEDAWRNGRDAERGEVMQRVRSAFAQLIGAETSEIGLVHCTKAGEQIVLDGLPELRSTGKVVTNDLHFGGSLHNLIGMSKSGLNVHIVRSRDWNVPLDAMEEAIDETTTLVSVTMVSNVNGRLEPLRKLTEVAHARGALVYADIIQAAGVVPIDVKALGVDFAACSGYKWLFGPHGVGFFFCRKDRQGTSLRDSLFPGFARPNYPPWVEEADPEVDSYGYVAPTDARRYQPGHVSYLGYSALYEGLKFIGEIGVGALRDHSVGLVRRLLQRIDRDKYPCISPDTDVSPIVSFARTNARSLEERLRARKLVISHAPGYLRVSPAIYNTEEDIDRLAEALNEA